MNSRNNFALLFAVLSWFLIYTNAQYRIWNGKDRNIEKSPYLASIHDSGIYICTGALISLQMVLTAAHCVAYSRGNLIVVEAGITDLDDTTEDGQMRGVESIHHPCDYSPETGHMDIAVIKLHTPFRRGSRVEIIELCDTTLNLGTKMRVSGWGATSGDNERYSCTLQTTNVNIVLTQECAPMAAILGNMITESMICATRDGTSPCQGDSGAPGVVKGKLCAVVSYGICCANPSYPTVYTDVNNAKVRNFLRDAMAWLS
ncbi:trypsin alpha-like [Eurosta solidaginis]|uniref:trypsin alpha-like n=1 Tax=Eurosta solidaginis TaxID=178769 RepID=UPI003530EC42